MQHLGLLHGSVLVNRQWGLSEEDKGSSGGANFIFPIKFNTIYVALGTPNSINNLIGGFGIKNLATTGIMIDAYNKEYLDKYYIVAFGK